MKHSAEYEAGNICRGRNAEQAACLYLQQQGLELLERNFRCKIGELDLIMAHREDLVFVEVRYRRHSRFGGALESIDRHKQTRLINAAKIYLQQRKLTRKACRFDVVCISGEDPSGDDILWIKNAFDA